MAPPNSMNSGSLITPQALMDSQQAANFFSYMVQQAIEMSRPVAPIPREPSAGVPPGNNAHDPNDFLSQYMKTTCKGGETVTIQTYSPQVPEEDPSTQAYTRANQRPEWTCDSSSCPLNKACRTGSSRRCRTQTTCASYASRSRRG